MPLLYCQSVRQDMILKKDTRVCEKCPSIDKKYFCMNCFIRKELNDLDYIDRAHGKQLKMERDTKSFFFCCHARN